MDKYIETKGMKLISKSGYDKYPYLLEVTEFVKNSNNVNNYNGERQFRLLNANFIATGDGYSFSSLHKSFPNCEVLEIVVCLNLEKDKNDNKKAQNSGFH